MTRQCKDCGGDTKPGEPCEYCRLVDLAYPKHDDLLDMPAYGLVGAPGAAEVRAIRKARIEVPLSSLFKTRRNAFKGRDDDI